MGDPIGKIFKDVVTTVTPVGLGYRAYNHFKDESAKSKAEKDAKEAKRRGDLEAAIQSDAQNSKQAKSVADSVAAQQAERKRRQQQAAANRGRRSTILTSPIGLLGQSPKGGRDFLGG
jgi:ATPase subunit of ABC transporter with duplicated ATPase domains